MADEMKRATGLLVIEVVNSNLTGTRTGRLTRGRDQMVVGRFPRYLSNAR